VIPYRIPYRTIMILTVIVVAVFVLLSWRASCTRNERMKEEATIADAVAVNLDKVAKETPAIRQDQQEKQDAVDEIEGSDGRLPAGYGAELERLRRNGKPQHP